MITRKEYADLILEKLEFHKLKLKDDFNQPNQIKSFYIDDLLPEDLALEIYKAFPPEDLMAQRKTLREYKRVAAQMNKFNPILEEIIFAFQDNRIVDLCTEITGLKQLIPDQELYAGGISLMSEGNFLRPHLDNSHDRVRENYRVLNLLYYVTPKWKQEYGGNLELWDNGVKNAPRIIFSKFNRLAVMITNKTSYHSVAKVVHAGARCCVSNYYFSPVPADDHEYFHVTSFRGRNDEPMQDVILRTDNTLRSIIRYIFPKGAFKVWQKYDKADKATK